MNKQEIIASLDELMARGMAECNQPGVGVAVLRDREILFMKGYGLRNLDDKLPIDENTVFRMASNTKAFVSMSMAMLVDDGLLDWDRPIKHYIPDFQMADDYMTNHMNVRDVLSHRTGLPIHNGACIDPALTRKDIIGLLRYLEPNCDMRTRLQYNNRMMLVCAYLLECLTGETWERFVERRILRPLGMTRSGFHFSPFVKDGNYAKNVFWKDGAFQPYFIKEEDGYPDVYRPHNPAGGLCSSLKDMATWVKLHLNKGMHEGVRIVSEENLHQVHKPHMVDEWPGAGRDKLNPSGALGWFVTSYMGYKSLNHGGYYGTVIQMLPEEGIGIVCLPMRNDTVLEEVYGNTAFDLMLDQPKRDWLAIRLEERRKAIEQSQKLIYEMEQKRLPTAPVTLPLEAYEGAYSHPAYGTFTIHQQDGRLAVQFYYETNQLRHVGNHAFDTEPEFIRLTFQPDESGRIHQVSIPFEPTVSPIVFVRRG